MMSPAYAFFFWQSSALPGDETAGFTRALLQIFCALALVCALAGIAVRVLLPRLTRGRERESLIRVMDSLALEPRKRLHVVEVAGRRLLISTSESGTQLLGELEAGAVEKVAPVKSPPARAFSALLGGNFARLLNRRR